jgi:hypothetical protein
MEPIFPWFRMLIPYRQTIPAGAFTVEEREEQPKLCSHGRSRKAGRKWVLS